MQPAPILETEIPFWVWDCLDDKTQDLVTWITGGLGSGKTYGSALWHIEMCRRNWRSKYSWVVAPTHAKVNSIIVPAIVEVLNNHYGWREGRDFSVHGGAPAEVYLKRTNQTIYGHSANKWRLMVGENISHFTATEVGYYQSRDWLDKCQFRARCPKAEVIQGLGEGTPEGLENWYAEVANLERENVIYPETLMKRIRLETADNPHLRAGYVDKVKRSLAHDPGKLESYLYGRFVPFTKGTAYWEFFHSRNVVLDVAPSHYLPILMCWDFNKSPLAWVAAQRQPHETRSGYRYHRFTALHESSGAARGIMDACVEFMAAYPPGEWRESEIRVYGDPSGYFGSHRSPSDDYDQIYQYLRSYYPRLEIVAAKAAPTIHARLERHNALLANEELVVAAWLRNTIRSHSTTALRKGMWQIEKPKDEDWTHYGDALGYMLFQETKHEDLTRNPAPQIHGINI